MTMKKKRATRMFSFFLPWLRYFKNEKKHKRKKKELKKINMKKINNKERKYKN
jgi:hypothetical protein